MQTKKFYARFCLFYQCAGRMEFDLTDEQHEKVEQWLNFDRRDRPYVQTYLPFLSSTEREFLITGMTEEQQAEFYGEEDD